MHLPRFRLRTLMIAIVALGAAFWCELMRERRRDYLARAAIHANEAQSWLKDAVAVERMMAKPRANGNRRRVAELDEVARNYRSWRDRCARLARRYEQAANRPWLPVWPDPPPK